MLASGLRLAHGSESIGSTFVFPDEANSIYDSSIAAFGGLKGWLTNFRHERNLHVIASKVGGMMQGYLLDGGEPYIVSFPDTFYPTIKWLRDQPSNQS